MPYPDGSALDLEDRGLAVYVPQSLRFTLCDLYSKNLFLRKNASKSFSLKYVKGASRHPSKACVTGSLLCLVHSASKNRTLQDNHRTDR